MKTNIIVGLFLATVLTACAQPSGDVQTQSSKSSTPAGSSVFGNTPGLGTGVGVGSGAGVGMGSTPPNSNQINPVQPSQPAQPPIVNMPQPMGVVSISKYSQLIKQYYDMYLPNCYNGIRADFYEGWFARGGTEANFAAGLKIAASGTHCNADGSEVTTEPHYIKGYFDFYLPGCYTPEKGAYWQAWFDRGGVQADYLTTLMNLRISSPRPSCLTN